MIKRPIPVDLDPNTPKGAIVSMCARSSSIDELVLETGLSLTNLNAALFDLQLEGIIKQNFAGMWERI